MKEIENIGTCVAPSYFSLAGFTPEEARDFALKQISIMSLLIALYPIISSYYPECEDVLEPRYNLTKNQVDEIMKNPFSYDFGDYNFAGSQRFNSEYLSRFNMTPHLK